MIYLDHAATTPVRREALEAMWPYLTGEFGNPSSHHEVGRSAAVAIRDAREMLADWLGCRASEIIFTSGGTESDNLAVKGVALAAPRGRHIVTSAIEHPAILESCDYLERHHGFEITRVGVNGDGLVDPDAVRLAVRGDTTLCTIMLANNEVGAIQPIAEIARIAHDLGVPVHSDAVQAAGSLDLRVDSLGVDALSASGHKIGAPKGVGLLFARGRLPLEAVIHGGGQERGRRSGTENVAGIVGLAAAVVAAEADREQRSARTSIARDAFIDEVLVTVPDARLTGPREPRLPASASFCFPGTSGESVLLRLEERGITCSSGSACAAGSDEPSSVLLAMGIDPAVAQTAVRFTLGDDTTAEQLHEVAGAVRAAVASVRSLGA